MSRVVFDDKSYVEIKKSKEPGKFMVIIQAKDGDNALKKITNCVELSKEELITLLSDVKP